LSYRNTNIPGYCCQRSAFWDCYRNMGHFLCSVERTKRFVNVHLHCIVFRDWRCLQSSFEDVFSLLKTEVTEDVFSLRPFALHRLQGLKMSSVFVHLHCIVFRDWRCLQSSSICIASSSGTEDVFRLQSSGTEDAVWRNRFPL